MPPRRNHQPVCPVLGPYVDSLVLVRLERISDPNEGDLHRIRKIFESDPEMQIGSKMSNCLEASARRE